MKRCRYIFGLFLLGALSSPSGADTFTHAGLFANAKEVFRPLIADPQEIQLALRWTVPVGGKGWGDADIGEYLGLYRWVLPWQNSYVQWSVAGGIFTRFELVAGNKANQFNDFAAQRAIDVSVG